MILKKYFIITDQRFHIYCMWITLYSSTNGPKGILGIQLRSFDVFMLPLVLRYTFISLKSLNLVLQHMKRHDGLICWVVSLLPYRSIIWAFRLVQIRTSSQTGNLSLRDYKQKSWTGKQKNLSFGGRLTLIQLVLGNLLTYYLSLFVALQV